MQSPSEYLYLTLTLSTVIACIIIDCTVAGFLHYMRRTEGVEHTVRM